MTEMFSGSTQVFWTCKALIGGRAISHQTEIREVRGWRLGAIIHRLKQEYAWPITTDYLPGSRIAIYRLNPDTDLTRLRFPPSAAELAKEVAK